MNTLLATVKFDYQGQHYHLKTQLDIDKIIHHEDFYNSVYFAIARDNNIGLYSYHLEVLMDQNIVFSKAQGCAVGCVDDMGNINIQQLKTAQQIAESLPVVNSILTKILPQEKDNQSLINAMTQAYLAGKISAGTTHLKNAEFSDI
jgi:hypothetical protein